MSRKLLIRAVTVTPIVIAVTVGGDARVRRHVRPGRRVEAVVGGDARRRSWCRTSSAGASGWGWRPARW